MKYEVDDKQDIYDVVHNEIMNSRIKVYQLMKSKFGLKDITFQVDDILSDLAYKAPSAALDHIARRAGLNKKLKLKKRKK